MSRIASPLDSGLTLPPGEKERLVRESRGPMALGVIFGFYSMSIICVGTRIYVRTRVSKQAGMDDWVVAGSEVICTVMVVFIYFQIYHGDGRHLLALTADDANAIAKMNFGALICWTISVTGAKASILLQYIRWFTFRRTIQLIWVLMVVVILSGISTLVVVLTACIPLDAVWDSEIRDEAKCLDQRLYWQIQSAFEAVVCWIMLGLLIPPLWRLQMPKAKKIGIIILLGLSSSSCVASILRMKSAFDAIPKSADVVHDFTWTGIFATMYAAMELLLGIICCSLPALMPLRYKMMPCWFKKDQRRLPPARAPRPAPQPPQEEVQQNQAPNAQPLLPSCSSIQPEHMVAVAARPLLPTCHTTEAQSLDGAPIRNHSLAQTSSGSSGDSLQGSVTPSVNSNDSQRPLSGNRSHLVLPRITEMQDT